MLRLAGGQRGTEGQGTGLTPSPGRPTGRPRAIGPTPWVDPLVGWADLWTEPYIRAFPLSSEHTHLASALASVLLGVSSCSLGAPVRAPLLALAAAPVWVLFQPPVGAPDSHLFSTFSLFAAPVLHPI